MLDLMPYEVFVFVFNLLDNESLLNACLVNHAMNDIASRSLYRTLVVNKVKKGLRRIYWRVLKEDIVDAFIVFRRLPGLRAAVQNVVLNPSTVYVQDEVNTEAYSELAKLKNVKKISLCKLFLEVELNCFFTAARELPLLETMVYTEMIIRRNQAYITMHPPTPNDLNQVHRLDLCFYWTTMPEWIKNHIAGRIRNLKIKWISDYESAMSLKTLSNLEDITLLLARPDPMGMCAYLGSAKSLTRITIDIRWERNRTLRQLAVEPNASDTGLTGLESLKLNLHTQQDELEIMILHGLVRSLASHSRLRKLAILSPSSYPPYMRKKCDQLVSHIISCHAPTLHKLQLPFFNATKPMLSQILDRCIVLKGLWIAVISETKSLLPRTLAGSNTLETLRLFGRGKWLYSFAGSLLSQVHPGGLTNSLSCVKVCCDRDRKNVRKFVWKVSWTYDTVLNRPVRRLHGPLFGQVTAPAKLPPPEPYGSE
ncbi:hypothetical protein FRB91_004150 [Serendipita sp. 411]|nr:hypothetical protein FRC18_004462 [Serendipita sp. 400]KAG8842498.1 hypothetical protein FRB91_004150 [Serendipita sp. 411]